MSVKLLIEHHLEFVSLKGGCTGSSESPLVKMPHCWKSRVTTHVNFCIYILDLSYLNKKDREIRRWLLDAAIVQYKSEPFFSKVKHAAANVGARIFRSV